MSNTKETDKCKGRGDVRQSSTCECGSAECGERGVWAAHYRRVERERNAGGRAFGTPDRQ